MRRFSGCGAVILALYAPFAVVGCAGSPSSSPSAPSSTAAAPSGPPTALKIVGAPNSYIVVGDTAQFKAMATMSNGAASDVTDLAVWSTSDASIFSVAAGGKVTALKPGSADVRATYQTVSDKDYTTAQPFLMFRAYGTVTEAPPDFRTLGGARVVISPGPTGPLFATTDGAGDFSFPPLKGGNYTVTVTRDGFHPQTRTFALTRDVRADFPLLPVPPAGATARCKDKSWSFATDKAAACSRNGGVSYWACPGPFCQP